MSDQPVGLVVGTEDSTPLQFGVALAPRAVPAARRRRGHRPLGARRRRRSRRPAWSPRCVARHEGATFGSDVFLIADGVLPAQVQEIAEVTTTRVEPECYVPPTPAIARPPRHRRRARARRCTSTRWTSRCRSGSAATASRSTSTSSSSTARAADTCRSAASPASRPRPASRCSCSTRSSAAGCSATRSVNAKALVFSVKGEDLLFLDHANTRLDERAARPATPGSGCPAEPFASVGFFAPPTPDDLAAARTSPAGPAASPRSGGRCRVLRRRAAALRVRRRRGRAQPVHDGGPPGRRAAAAGRATGRRTVPSRSRGRSCAPTTRSSSSSPSGSPTRTTRRDWAGPVTGTGTINAFLRRLRSSLKPLRTHRPRRPRRHPGPSGEHRGPAGHRRRPAQPARSARSVSSSVWCSRRRPRARRPPGRAACCSR